MLGYTVRRVLWMAPVLFFVSLITFSLSYFSPSDPITAKYSRLGAVVPVEQIAQEREEAGLNDPFFVQYGRWIAGVAHGDLGTSFSYSGEATTVILSRLPVTLWLAASTIICTIVLSVPLGILAALRKGKPIDLVLRLISFLGVSMPSFWVALLLMWLFGVRLQWLPVQGSSTPAHLILPCASLTFWLVSLYVRRLRSSMLEELDSPQVSGAYVRGVPRRVILWRHVLPNSLLGVVTMLGMSVGALLGGATVVETVFGLQGVGKLAVEAIGVRDYPVIMGYALWVAFAYVLVNLIVDLACHALDPRIRLGVSDRA